jgi:hypothetical protein
MSTLQWSDIAEAKKRFDSLPPVRPLEIKVFDFREQFRFPRTKKRRIRNKWKKRPENWRSKTGQAYKMETPQGGDLVIVSEDVKRQLDSQANAKG